MSSIVHTGEWLLEAVCLPLVAEKLDHRFESEPQSPLEVSSSII